MCVYVHTNITMKPLLYSPLQWPTRPKLSTTAYCDENNSGFRTAQSHDTNSILSKNQKRIVVETGKKRTAKHKNIKLIIKCAASSEVMGADHKHM